MLRRIITAETIFKPLSELQILFILKILSISTWHSRATYNYSEKQ